MPRHFYFHIPFCHRICPYCSFYKHTPGSTDMPAFVRAMLGELEARTQSLELRPRTLYFGGGTPSMLSRTHLRTLLEGIRSTLDLSQLEEWTLEANPATFDLDKARLMLDAGVTRISLGVQSWAPEVLRVPGRDHAPEQAQTAFDTLRDAGFENINLDLMFAVPGQSHEQWEESLRRTVSLQPDHISAYNLTYEEDTDYMKKFRRGEFTESQDENARFFDTAMRRLEGAGFHHYEISNYARPGNESLHNQSYWRGEEYIGIGPSAVSTVANLRTVNVPETGRYIEQITRGDSAASETENLSEKSLTNEAIALRLRTTEGLPLQRAPHVTDELLAPLIEERLVTRENNRILLTRRGKFLADAIAEHLLL